MIELHHGFFGFSMEDDGSFSVATPYTTLKKAHLEAQINQDTLRLSPHCTSSSETTAVFEEDLPQGHFTFRVSVEAEAVHLNLACGLKAFPIDIKLVPLAMDKFSVDQLICQGRRMGSCFNYAFPSGKTNPIASHFYVGARVGNGHLLLSTPLRKRLHSEFSGKLAADGVAEFRAFASTCHEDCLDFDSGDLTITAGTDPVKLTQEWSDKNIEVKKFDPSIFACGWNSWDYYRWTITEEQILANADFIRKDPVLSKKIRRIIVDDGWQYCYGEWEPNPFFPHGMKYLADEITKMGFEPGLWMAPAVIEPHSRIAQLTPGWLAMGESGQVCLSWECMGRQAAVLDPTVPAAREHLRKLFDKYAGYGYKYFKLDFLFAALQARQYHDRTIPHTDLVRLIVKAASEGVNGRAIIMGCNYPFDAGNRYVDAVRVGSDVHAGWEDIQKNSTAISINFWGTGRHWLCDPDFALCRSFDTSDDPEINTLNPNAIFGTLMGPPLPGVAYYQQVETYLPETEVLLSLVLVSGGAVNFSDRMDRLNQKGLDLARRTADAVHGEQGIPLDLYQNTKPCTWLQKLPDGKHRILLINWDDSPKEMSFDCAAHGIHAVQGKDFWHDTALPVANGVLKTSLAPRSCLLAEL